MVSNGVFGAICSWHVAGFTIRCLLTCDKAGAEELAASGPLGNHGNHCASMLATAVSRERAQGNCWHDRMVWAGFLPQVPVLALVRSTRARPRCQFWTSAVLRYGRFGGPISVWVKNYVCVATWKSEVRLTSCPLVQSLTVFPLLEVAGPTGGQVRLPHLRSDWRPRWANQIPFVKAGQSGRCSDREFAFVLDNLVSTIN